MKSMSVWVCFGLMTFVLGLGLGCDQGSDVPRPGSGNGSDSGGDTGTGTVGTGGGDTGTGSQIDDVPVEGVGFVRNHGRIQVNGNRFVDKNGNTIRVRGGSLYWSHWKGAYFNADLVRYLVEEWGTTLIRAPLGVMEDGQGYIAMDAAGRAAEVRKIEIVVEAAIANGIYVIIDFHDHYANRYVAEAKSFLGAMAQKYGHHPNVIFEIWNEPLNETWATIKAYAEEVIPVIRAHSSNLILVGTPNYSYSITAPIGNTINDPNVGYVFHFYVGLHPMMDIKVNQYQAAVDAGLPVFITEWGAWTDAYEGGDWRQPLKTAQFEASSTLDNALEWLDSTNASWAMWSICDQGEPSAWLNGSAAVTGGWNPSTDLRTVGQYMYSYFQRIK